MSDVDSVHTPVTFAEVTVREFRPRFTGQEQFKAPVEVRAYGRLVGHWFPAGTIPACYTPPDRPDPYVSPGPADSVLQPLPARGDGSRPARPPLLRSPISEKQRQRDSWLRGVSRTSKSDPNR